MKKIFFILLAGALSFNTVAQEFGDGSTGKRHKKSHSQPKKHKAKKREHHEKKEKKK